MSYYYTVDVHLVIYSTNILITADSGIWWKIFCSNLLKTLKSTYSMSMSGIGS